MATMLEIRRALLLFMLLLHHHLTIPSLASSSSRRDLLAFNPASKKLGGEPAPNCSEMASKTDCERSSRWCRWCRSDALDDMCFGAAEAWRLPSQVFSCDTSH